MIIPEKVDQHFNKDVLQAVVGRFHLLALACHVIFCSMIVELRTY